MDDKSKGTRTGQRHRSALEWAELLAAWRASGKTQAVWCQQQGLSKESLRRWIKRLRAQGAEHALVHLRREPVADSVEASSWIRVRRNGEVDLLGPFREEVLRGVLRVVSEQADVR